MADQTNTLTYSALPRATFETTPNAARTKVTPSHLKRDAFLYVRQSTLHQVMQNTESTQRHAEGVHSSSERWLSAGRWTACM
jgi:hypothetical protein